MNLPPLSALRAFEAACRTGGMTAAGAELNVTHAAVSQQVRRLEEWFGTALLRREGRGVAPTVEGARLAAGLEEGFAAIRRACEALSAEAAAKPLRITLTPAFAARWLMPRIGAFRAAHPEVALMLDPNSRLTDLVREGYDLAFRYGAGDWAGLDAEPVQVGGGTVVVAAPSLVAGRRVAEPADLLALPWVQELCADERGVWLRAHGLEPDEAGVLSLPGNLALDAIRRGEGVGITDRSWVEEDVAEGRLAVLFDGRHGEGLGYWMVRPPGEARPALRRFMAWVREQAASSA